MPFRRWSGCCALKVLYIKGRSQENDAVRSSRVDRTSTAIRVLFIQYTHARIRSVLRKAAEAGIDFGGAATADYLREEIDLVKSLTEYPSVVKSAGENFAPSVVGAYVYELAKQFNGYYHDHSILKEENAGVRTRRRQLAQQVARGIKEGMKLRGIDVPERM